MAWIDVHTHINMLELSPDDALAAAEAADVDRLITIGTNPDDLPTVLGLAQKYFPRVGCALGIHPHEAERWSAETDAYLRAHGPAPEVVAIGEIGLDYHYNNAPRDVQMRAFREQLKVAEDLGLPVEIHTRDAEDDTALILREYSGGRRGLLHCFTSSWALAEVGLANGYDISISGVVTFKNAEELREVVRRVPLDRLHVETDAPFLAPIPHRGKKNQPAFVVHTAEFVAQLKNLKLEDLSTQLRANAAALFPKLKIGAGAP